MALSASSATIQTPDRVEGKKAALAVSNGVPTPPTILMSLVLASKQLTVTVADRQQRLLLPGSVLGRGETGRAQPLLMISSCHTSKFWLASCHNCSGVGGGVVTNSGYRSLLTTVAVTAVTAVHQMATWHCHADNCLFRQQQQ